MRTFVVSSLGILLLPSLAVADTSAPKLVSLQSSTPFSLDHGEGCPEGSYRWEASSDNQRLKVIFTAFDVAAGQQFPESAMKTCNLLANFDIPAGFQVGLSSLTIRGSLEATDSYSRGRVEANYRWERDHYETLLMNRPFSGPYNNDFTVTDSLSYDRISYSPCSYFDQRNRMELASVHSAQGDRLSLSRLSESRFERAIVYEYGITFRQCNGSNPPPPPPSNYWVGSCRSVLETVWGADIRTFNGRGTGYSRSEAIRAARIDGLDQCEIARNNDNLTRCVSDDSSCTAVPR